MALQLWLPLNGNLDNQGLDGDVSITTSNTSWQDNGKIGKCIKLGTINKFYIPSMIGKKQLSFCYWVRVNTATSTNWLDSITWYSTDGTTAYTSRQEFYNNSTYTSIWYKGGSMDGHRDDNMIGQWKHYAFTIDYETGMANYYINGNKFGTTHTNVDTTHYLRGDFSFGQSGLDLSENDIRIYDHILSPREIKEIAKGLVLHYPLSGIGNLNLCVPQFDDTKWTLWSNGSSWNSINTREKVVDENGKTWIHVVQTTTAGYGGYACTSGTNGNGIVIDPNKKYTISVLAKTNEATTQKMVLWCHWRVAGGGGSNLAQTVTTVDVTSTPKRVYATWTPTAGSTGSTVGSINIMLGVNGNISDIYFTDIKFEEGEIATSYMPYVIGTGNIYDFESIASKWVVENSSIANYNDPEYGNVLQVTTTGADQRIYRNVSNIWTASTKYTVSFLAKANVPTRCDMSRSLADFTQTFNLTTQWKRYTGIINCTTTATSGTLSFRLRTAGTAYITNITLEKGDTTSAYQGIDNIEYDVSGYKRNGIKNGNIISSSDTARYTTSSVFDGTATYIEANPLPAETKTISCWIKTTWASSSGYRLAIHDKATGLAIGWSGYNIITYVGSGNGGLGSQFVNSSGAYQANQWNHIVIIKTGDTTRDIYINGNKVTPTGGNYWGGDLNKLNIGNRHYSGSYSAYFNGQISDFRAYVTALSAEDIETLYHTPISLSSSGTLLTQGEYVES